MKRERRKLARVGWERTPLNRLVLSKVLELLDRLRQCKGELIELLLDEDRRSFQILRDAGWRPKKRCGKTIWKNPEPGFWCSQEVAMMRLESDAGPEARDEQAVDPSGP